jgi:hypothetical protein
MVRPPVHDSSQCMVFTKDGGGRRPWWSLDPRPIGQKYPSLPSLRRQLHPRSRKTDTECLPGGSRSRVPPCRRRYADPPTATPRTGLGMREFPNRGGATALLGSPICSPSLWARFPRPDGPWDHFEAKGSVRGRIQARTAPIRLRMVRTTSESVFPPSPPSLPSCSLCQRRCRPSLRFGPAGDCRCACRSDWRHRDGERIKAAPAGRVRLSPPARIEQGTSLHFRVPRILAMQLSTHPAHYNHAALSPGLHCRDML